MKRREAIRHAYEQKAKITKETNVTSCVATGVTLHEKIHGSCLAYVFILHVDGENKVVK
jgi:hypothetical protein